MDLRKFGEKDDPHFFVDICVVLLYTIYKDTLKQEKHHASVRKKDMDLIFGRGAIA